MVLLPTKHLRADRSLLAVGAVILKHVKTPIAFSELWQKTRKDWERVRMTTLSYDVFLSALSILYAMGAVEHEGGIIRRPG